jgi:Rrf2 family protein
VRVSARADYALRALIELAGAYPNPRKGDELAHAQGIPLKFLGNILQQLKSAGLIRTLRGAEGGYWLTVAPEKITLADVIRAVDGPLANVRGTRPEAVKYAGKAEPLRQVWIAVRASLRGVLEQVTLADVAEGRLPELVQTLAANPDAWEPHLTTKSI